MRIYNPPPSYRVFFTILVIVIGVAISSLGELRFVLTGFLIQGAAVIFEAFKNALQQFLLNGKTKMSSLTLLFYFAPACAVVNALWIVVFEWRGLMEGPKEAGKQWPGLGIFLMNGVATFALNIASVTVVSI